MGVVELEQARAAFDRGDWGPAFEGWSAAGTDTLTAAELGPLITRWLRDQRNSWHGVEYPYHNADPEFWAEMNDLWTHYVGRPSPLYYADRLRQTLKESAAGAAAAGLTEEKLAELLADES